MVNEDAVAAAVRLLSKHRRYEDTDTDDDGRTFPFEACEWDDEDWPCETVRVAEALLDAVNAA